MIRFIVVYGLALLLFSGCSKSPNDKLLGAGILITVDKNADTWFPYRQFLKEHGAKLTFYIEEYHTLDSAQKARLLAMVSDGHEVAHHTKTHPHCDEYVADYGMQQFIDEEILSVTALMQQDGFNPQTFAYPFGDCTTELDKELIKHFKSVRKIIDTYSTKRMADMDQAYYRFGNLTFFYACGIDRRYKHPMEEIEEALEVAKNSRSTISLYTHYITPAPLENDPSESYIIDTDFKQIILKAEELGLTFYTASEVSRNH